MLPIARPWMAAGFLSPLANLSNFEPQRLVPCRELRSSLHRCAGSFVTRSLTTSAMIEQLATRLKDSTSRHHRPNPSHVFLPNPDILYASVERAVQVAYRHFFNERSRLPRIPAKPPSIPRPIRILTVTAVLLSLLPGILAAAEPCECFEGDAYSTAPGNLSCLVLDPHTPPCELRWLHPSADNNRSDESATEQFFSEVIGTYYDDISSTIDNLDRTQFDYSQARQNLIQELRSKGAPHVNDSQGMYALAANYLHNVEPKYYKTEFVRTTLLSLFGSALQHYVNAELLSPEAIISFVSTILQDAESITERMRSSRSSTTIDARTHDFRGIFKIFDASTYGCFEFQYTRDSAEQMLLPRALMFRTQHSDAPRCARNLEQ